MGIVLKLPTETSPLMDTTKMFNNIKLLLVGLVVVISTGCASTSHNSNAGADKQVSDPFEGVNRAVFSFNSGLDTYLLKPVTKGYRFITPDYVETRVSNFFSNLLEIRNILNSLLQGKGAQAANHTGRFLFNTTIGLAGFYDVASTLDMEKTDGEDFGQTLGAWGVGTGPYIVLPFLGPSNLRDGVSIPVDIYADPVTYVDHVPTRNALNITEIIDTRSQLLETEKLLTGDRYVFIRDAYLQRREYLVEDGEVEDTFGTDIKGDF